MSVLHEARSGLLNAASKQKFSEKFLFRLLGIKLISFRNSFFRSPEFIFQRSIHLCTVMENRCLTCLSLAPILMFMQSNCMLTTTVTK
jgi:hypothetical protein